jgi:hypothetical protein
MTANNGADHPDDDLDRTASGIVLPPPEDSYRVGIFVLQSGHQSTFVAETDEDIDAMAAAVQGLQRDPDADPLHFQDPNFGHWHWLTHEGAKNIAIVGPGYAKKVDVRAQPSRNIVLARGRVPRQH